MPATHQDAASGDVPATSAAEPPTAPSSAAQGGPDDPLLRVRAAIETVEDLPVPDRADVFEQVHQVVVEELRQLELG